MDDSIVQELKKDFSDAFDFCVKILKLNNHYFSVPNNNDTTSRRSVIFGQKMYSLMMGLMKEMMQQTDVNDSSSDDEYLDDDDEQDLEINNDFLRSTSNNSINDWDHDYCRSDGSKLLDKQTEIPKENSECSTLSPEAGLAGDFAETVQCKDNLLFNDVAETVVPWNEASVSIRDSEKTEPENPKVFDFVSEQENPVLNFVDELTEQQETTEFNTTFIDDPYEDPFLNATEKLTEPTDKASSSFSPKENGALNHASIGNASSSVEEPYYTFWPSPVESDSSDSCTDDEEDITSDNSMVNKKIKKPTYQPEIKKTQTKVVTRKRAPIEEKIKVVEMADKNPNLSWMTIKKMTKCKYLTCGERISTWREQIGNGGTVTDRINIINAAVYVKFLEHKKLNKSVSNDMLQKWALEAKKTALPLRFQFFKFVASARWRLSFKKKYNIVGHHADLVVESSSDQDQEIKKGKRRQQGDNNQKNVNKPERASKRKTRLSEQISNLKMLKGEASYDEKLKVVNLARKNPTWSLNEIKNSSGCKQLKFVSQLHDWKREIAMANGSL